jgi:hypothetical protein
MSVMELSYRRLCSIQTGSDSADCRKILLTPSLFAFFLRGLAESSSVTEILVKVGIAGRGVEGGDSAEPSREACIHAHGGCGYTRYLNH